MLVLSRGKDESIMIGEDVEIRILDIRGNTVRLGITAPKSITVHRREIFEAIERQKLRDHSTSMETVDANEPAMAAHAGH